MWQDGGAAASEEHRYLAWSVQFFVRRMAVLIAIGMLAYATFVVRDYLAYRDSFTRQIPFYVLGFSSLTLTWGAIYWFPSRWLPAVLPLAVWGFGFVPHVLWSLFSGRPLAQPNLSGWMIIMLSTAVLVPIFWKAHVVAYAGLITYLALYLLVDPVASMAGLAEQSFYVIWTAIICALAVFFYERLQRVELVHQWQLEEANRRLQELDRVKTDFFANVSHELRTPLTLILGTFRRLAAGTESEHARELIDSGLRNTARLLVLIQEFLDLARLDSGRARPVKRTVDVAQLVRQVASNFESSGPHKRITLTGAQEPLFAELDLYQVRKVLYNLFSNAFKFNDPETAHVWVRLRHAPDTVIIEVEDNGFGIPEEELPHIFDRFARAKNADQRREGTGIGLALAKEIVEAHGGTIEVRSTVGQGTTFTITLPRGQYDPEAVVGLEEDRSNELIDFIYRQEVRRMASSGPAVSTQPRATADANAPLLLVADDNHDMRAYLCHLLAPHYRLIEAENGHQALELAREHRPELIITDVMMPHMTGHELLRAIRADEELARTPVIFLTAKAGNEARVEALEAGADDYLAKPFDENELLARVRNLLRARAQERQLAELNRRLEAKVAEQMAELIRTGELKRFLSPSVVEHVLSGTHHRLGLVQRRDVTILFVDIVGFTTLTSHLDPGTLIKLLNTYLREMTAIAVAARGTVDKFIGDALMVLFGAPHGMSAREQAYSAVQAALSMRQAAFNLAEQWVARGVLSSPFDVHMGLDTGPCAVGLFGSELQQSYTAIGTPVNVAARLQYRAGRGELLCTRRTYELVAEHVRGTPLGPIHLEGIAEPVEVVRVEGMVTSEEGGQEKEWPSVEAEEPSR
ncbi:MAG: response regulator [Ardenticatenia bacterium]|nr:response regulator [Ardenticatenia bacterium]